MGVRYSCNHISPEAIYATAMKISNGTAFAQEQEDMTRAMPMTTGVIDLKTPCKMFKDKGYTGPVLCEPIHPVYHDFRRMSAEDVVRTLAADYSIMEV